MKNNIFYLKKAMFFICFCFMSSILFEQIGYGEIENNKIMTEQEKLKDIEISYTTVVAI